MKTATLKLVIAWLAVILPLGWGVYQSAIKSKPLFLPTPAAAILRLADEGKLGLNDPLEKYFAGFPAGITLQHLLTHTPVKLPEGVDGMSYGYGLVMSELSRLPASATAAVSTAGRAI